MKWFSFLSKKTSIGYSYLIFGLLIASPLLEIFNLQLGIPIPYSAIDRILFLSWLLAVVLFIRKLNDFSFESRYAKIMIPLYLAYQLIIIGRVLPNLEGTSFKYFITNQYLLWPMVIPFLVFYDKTPDALVQATKVFLMMGKLFLLIVIIDFPLITSRLTGEPLICCLTLTIGFILFNMNHISNRHLFLALLATLVSLGASIFLARRSLILTFGMFLLVAGIVALKKIKFAKLIRILPLLAITTCIFIIYSDRIIPKMTERINERLTEDSRSYVVENFFNSMEKDMLFGKGMNGKYYSPIDETVYVEDGVKFDEIDFRDMIENGYLQSMLSGGILNVALFLMVILPAAFLGIFHSSNSFVKACGITIFLFSIDMLAYGLPRLTVQYLAVWLAVGICYKKSLRELENEDWKILFDKYKLT